MTLTAAEPIEQGDGHAVRRTAASRVARPVFLALGLVALGAVLFAVLLAVFRADERGRAEVRLAQHSSTLAAEMARFTHLPLALSGDGAIAAVVAGGAADALNARLARIAEATGAEAVYVMDAGGLTVAASNHDRSGSFLGQRYDFRPYFREAMAGRTGTFFGVGATTRRPGYFVAVPVRESPEEPPVGAVAVKVSLTPLERAWRAAGTPIFVSDADGVVLLASEPAWRYRTLAPLPPGRVERVRGSRQFAGADLAPFGGTAPGGEPIPEDAGAVFHLSAAGLPDGWTLHYLADDAPARLRASLGMVALMGLATTVLLVRQHRRTARVRSALDTSVHNERELRLANERLAREIEERGAAERRLRDTEDELRRAGRLAALGQMAASVSHELSQPIAAMRNHLMADELRRERDGSDGAAGQTRSAARLAKLVDRMEGITRQLKFFGRPGNGILSAIDLRDALSEALALVEPNIAAAGVETEIDRPDAPVIVRGNALRIEQVVVNLVRNAVDAVEGTDRRHVRVSVGTDGEAAVLRVSDSGPGLGGHLLDELAEPFVTTRASGRGMGLGLAISREIASEHGGALSARDGAMGGAEFELRLPLADVAPA